MIKTHYCIKILSINYLSHSSLSISDSVSSLESLSESFFLNRHQYDSLFLYFLVHINILQEFEDNTFYVL